MTLKIGLVSCCSKKLDRAAPAHELYQSPMFLKSLRLAERENQVVFILSAKYGLLPLGKVVEPYDLRLGQVDRPVWGAAVARALADMFGGTQEDIEITFYAGADYVTPVIDAIAALCWAVLFRLPMKGMQVGERLHWLNEQLGAAPCRTVLEDVLEALDEAATSLETASKWGTRKGNDGNLSAMRPWAANRAEVARRALAAVEGVR